jgi:probable phosphoglycerate mutase
MSASVVLLMQRARKAAAMMQKPCEIILVRHGETAWNKEGRLQGQEEPGPPLDDLGHQQAAVVGFAVDGGVLLQFSCMRCAELKGPSSPAASSC